MQKCAFIILSLLALQINSLTCGGNCPAGNCPDCPCGVVKEILNSTWITNNCKILF